jgi:outer membrane receptor for ferrienterochelin and colicins
MQKKIIALLVAAFSCLNVSAQQFGSDPFISQFLGKKAGDYSLFYNTLYFPNDLASPMLLRSFSRPWESSIIMSQLPALSYDGYQNGRGSLLLQNLQARDRIYSTIANNGENISGFSIGRIGRIYDRNRGELRIRHNFKGWFSQQYAPNKTDRNGDGYMDSPLSNNMETGFWHIFSNRKNTFTNDNTFCMFKENTLQGPNHVKMFEKSGEQNHGRIENHADLYTFNTHARYSFKKSGQNSMLNFRLQAKSFSQNSYWGTHHYTGKQGSLHADVYFIQLRNQLFNYTLGLSARLDDFRELMDSTTYNRNERSIGAYAEMRIPVKKGLNIEPYYRADYHSLYGWIHSPRMKANFHINKYSKVSLLFMHNRRMANIFSENEALLTGSRQVEIREKPQPERSAKVAAAYTYKRHKWNVTVNLHHIYFRSRVIADIDAEKNMIIFYNLRNNSFENSLEAKAAYPFSPTFSIEALYRFDDNRAKLNGKMRQIPFYAKHNAMFSLRYVKGFSMNFSALYTGPKNLGAAEERSNSFVTTHAHARLPLNYLLKYSGRPGVRGWTISAGIENLLGYRQKNVFVSNTDAGEFSGVINWAPAMGRRVYLSVMHDLALRKR